MYKTRDGNLMRLEQFQSLNNGKNLTKSQEKLLGLKKVKSKFNTKEYFKKYREKNREKYRKVCLSHYYKRKKELAEIRKRYANV